MIAHFNRFVNNGSGLEKTLRLIQSVAQIVAVFSVGSTAVRLTTVKMQLALTRRYFRFFGFIESFQRVSALLSKEGMGSVPGWIDLAKWTCFGLYFVLEDLTIVVAYHGRLYCAWEERVMREANQFWFYALSFSLIGAVYALLSPSPASKSKGKKGQKDEKVTAPTVNTSALVKQIVVESCDLLIPAQLLGWYPTGDLIVGMTMVLSTLITGKAIWSRV
ncbi:peroxin-11B Pex11B-Penicillium chrysogenum [Penicillium maclennaniae]|uniref:peroxin-11B Pex11B-Penicillium chrysogenum n=1 Tax=Penicillium maclennaniae TaxID=1343394 RepID=UPI00253F6CF8|nr:peroxin-11B Pex11B-Penicillium chrysogenum [Penicillium maclennaniae]KAJ5666501.1 peroxin-11B Pex11B-Penicillium chrysogenum [Penicillium maclennaniae]